MLVTTNPAVAGALGGRLYQVEEGRVIAAAADRHAVDDEPAALEERA